VGSFAALAALALSQPYKLREPDPYAYRAAMRAMASGNLTLDTQQYKQLDTELLEEGDGWDHPRFSLAAAPFIDGCGPGPFEGPVDLGPDPGARPGRPGADPKARPGIPDGCCPRRQGSFSGPLFGEPPPTGIAQWVYVSNGQCASEKNPGYPALAFLFDMLGIVRLAPLFYGALGCFGLWLGARRWLGPWGAAFAVGLFCSQPAVLLMAHRAYMPTFTDTALLAGGAGLVMWATLACDRSWRRRALAGAAGFLMLAVSVSARYTNLAPALIVAVWALFAARQSGARLGARIWLAWASGAVLPAIALALYNHIVFGKVLATGYEKATGGNPQWELTSVPGNLEVMPGRLLAAMPIWPAALAALALLGIAAARRRRGRANAGDRSFNDPPLETDTWIAPMLAGWWLSNWLLYSMFGWTHEAVPAGAYYIIAARFYLPAMGAIALLVAWLLVRIPPASGIVIVVALFVIAGISFGDALSRDWNFSTWSAWLGRDGLVASRYPAVPGRDGHRFELGVRAELLEDVAHVAADCVRTEVEPLGDGRGRRAFSE
jgi:hypothetical protein